MYLAPNQRGQPGYEDRLNDRVVTVARLLQMLGITAHGRQVVSTSHLLARKRFRMTLVSRGRGLSALLVVSVGVAPRPFQ